MDKPALTCGEETSKTHQRHVVTSELSSDEEQCEYDVSEHVITQPDTVNSQGGDNVVFGPDTVEVCWKILRIRSFL